MNWFLGRTVHSNAQRMSVIPSRFVDILYSINSFSCYSTSSCMYDSQWGSQPGTYNRNSTHTATPIHSINVMVFSSGWMFSCLMVICVIHSCSLNSFCSFVNFNSHREHSTLTKIYRDRDTQPFTNTWIDVGNARPCIRLHNERNTRMFVVWVAHIQNATLLCYWTESPNTHSHTRASNICRTRMTTEYGTRHTNTCAIVIVHTHIRYSSVVRLPDVATMETLDVCVHKCGSGMVSIVSWVI